ncbi:MAG TPA: mitofilin family membrane protein [Alphaproteobacteria bacterium]|nr:mitofilin family membrane protein [Alphaproteobacteria bacterium]
MADTPESASVTERIIERFGGIRPMAAKLDTPVTTVQGWKKRGIIPLTRHPDILAAAAREELALDADELAAADPTPSRVERPVETVALPPSPTQAPPSAPSLPVAPAETIVVKRGGAVAYLALLISLLALLAVVGGGYAAWQFYLQPLQARVAALEAHEGGNADLDARIAKLEAQQAQGGPIPSVTAQAQPKSAAAPDGERLAAIEQQLNDLKGATAQSAQIAKGLTDLQVAAGGRELLAQSIRDIQTSTAATQGEVDRLATQVAADRARLDAAEKSLSERRQQGLRAEAAILGVGQLRDALATSKPYVSQLSALRALVAMDPEMTAQLDQLKANAENGVPTLEDLQKEFARLAPDIVRGAVVGDGQSWWRQALYHVESVISVRRIGDSVPGDEVDAIVARAEGKLDEGDIQGAIDGLAALNGLPAETVGPWVAEAKQRIAADQAEAELTRLAIARVSAGTLPAQPTQPPPAPPQINPPAAQ